MILTCQKSFLWKQYICVSFTEFCTDNTFVDSHFPPSFPLILFYCFQLLEKVISPIAHQFSTEPKIQNVLRKAIWQTPEKPQKTPPNTRSKLKKTDGLFCHQRRKQTPSIHEMSSIFLPHTLMFWYQLELCQKRPILFGFMFTPVWIQTPCLFLEPFRGWEQQKTLDPVKS